MKETAVGVRGEAGEQGEVLRHRKAVLQVKTTKRWAAKTILEMLKWRDLLGQRA